MKRSVIVGAVALVAVLIGVLGWRSATGGTGRDDTDSRARPAAGSVTAEPGYRLVGRGRSVVEVPDGWKTNRTKCGTPLADTVVFHSEVVEDCLLMPLDNYSVVEIASYGVSFPPEDTKSSDGFYRKELLSKGDDARILVSSTDKAIFDRVVASYRRLPAGWTTVPDLFIGFSGGTPGVDAVPGEPEWTNRLERFGLKLEISRGDGRPTAEPAAGIPVRRGSTVTVTTRD